MIEIEAGVVTGEAQLVRTMLMAMIQTVAHEWMTTNPAMTMMHQLEAGDQKLMAMARVRSITMTMDLGSVSDQPFGQVARERIRARAWRQTWSEKMAEQSTVGSKKSRLVVAGEAGVMVVSIHPT